MKENNQNNPVEDDDKIRFSNTNTLTEQNKPKTLPEENSSKQEQSVSETEDNSEELLYDKETDSTQDSKENASEDSVSEENMSEEDESLNPSDFKNRRPYQRKKHGGRPHFRSRSKRGRNLSRSQRKIMIRKQK